MILTKHDSGPWLSEFTYYDIECRPSLVILKARGRSTNRYKTIYDMISIIPKDTNKVIVFDGDGEVDNIANLLPVEYASPGDHRFELGLGCELIIWNKRDSRPEKLWRPIEDLFI